MNVSISDYITEIFKRGLHNVRSWRLQAFAVKEDHIKDPYYPVPTATGVGFHNDDGEMVQIDGTTKPVALKPLLPHYTEFTLKKGSFNIVDKDYDTRIGIAIVNFIIFEPFHPLYPFLNKNLNKGDLTEPFLRDIIAGNNDEEYNIKFFDVMSDIEALFASDSEFILRSIVEGQFTQDKEHQKLKKRLIEENKDNLEDPLVVAKIQGEIAKSSSERYKKIGATLWQGGKSHNVTLMKTEGAYGSETAIDGNPSKYVQKSLREGIELDKLGTHVEVARYGSFGRGKLTALGGAAVNDAYQALGSRKSEIKDCGTKRGAPKRIREHNYKLFVGQALAGGRQFLTAEQLKLYIGKTINIRTPSKCAAGKDSCCHTCGGRDISRLPESIPTKASGFTSTIMDIAMQASHGVAAKTTRIDFFDDIF